MAARTSGGRPERRADRRYPLPVLEIGIGPLRFRAVNWSMRGVLLDGLCDVTGARVRGAMRLPGSRDAMPFTATVVRTDVAAGTSALCFEDPRTEGIEFPAQSGDGRLQ